MSKEKIRVWVHPDFKKKLKKEATDKGLDVLSYTKNISVFPKDENIKPKKQKFKDILEDLGF